MRERTIKTISGEKKLCFRLKYFEEYNEYNNDLISIVRRICPPSCTFDTKVMIAIGLLRWFFNYQRKEIQILFSARGVSISTGEISNLSEEFLLRFYVFHKKYLGKLRRNFDKKGGVVLHLDGTYEAGTEITFVAKEGRAGITLDAQIMPSESKEYINPFLENIRKSFGTPLVVIRDMWSEISDAVSEVFPKTPQQVCHFHFIRNLGNIIFKYRYERLRRLILNTRILAQLIYLKARIPEKSQSKDKLVIAEQKWAMLAIEYLLYPREQPSSYPFELQYFEIMNRIVEVKNMIRKIVLWDASQNFCVAAILDLSKKLKELINAQGVLDLYYQIGCIWRWFEKLRKTLKISRHLSGNEQISTPISSEEVRYKLKVILMAIEKEGRDVGGEIEKVSKKIIQNVYRHWDELTVEVMDNFGNELKIVRHNNVEEIGHRWSRMHSRRRTGRNKTTNDMRKYGALTSILSNLKNETYIKSVLTDVKDFVREMQDITKEEIQLARKMIRPYPVEPLVRNDNKRVSLLREFVEMLERTEKREELSVEGWLSKFPKSDGILTP